MRGRRGIVVLIFRVLQYHIYMKLLIDIDQQLFETVHRLSGAKTKKEAIVISLKEYLRNHEKEKVLTQLETYRHGMTLNKLLSSRKQWKRF